MKLIEYKWACGDCGCLHDHSRDALTCCAPYPEVKYLCPECDAEHDREYEAKECCEGDK